MIFVGDLKPMAVSVSSWGAIRVSSTIALLATVTVGCIATNPTPTSNTAEPAASPAAPRSQQSQNIQVFTPEDVSNASGIAPTASDVLPIWVTEFVSFPVQFERGRNSTSRRNTVPAKTSHSHEIQARAGQVLEVKLSSSENAALLNIFAPTGVVMVRESTAAAVQLPLDGEYAIGVIGQANAVMDYTLEIRIAD